MPRVRIPFLLVLLVGLVSAAAFHSSGALGTEDALVAADLRSGGVVARVLGLGVDLARLVHVRTGLFRAMHLTGGVLLAMAAALAGVVAFRAADGRPGAGLTAALFVGLATLFGGDTGRLGLAGGTFPVVLALLAGAAAAWTAATPRAFLGGVLVGLATAAHPLVLFVLPGFGALALGATLRVEPDRGSALLRDAALGFLLGAAGILLTGSGATSPGGALASWESGEGGPFWRPGGPRRWGAGVVELAVALGRNAGPLGILAGLAGLGAFFAGKAPLARPFLVVHLLAAGALILGSPGDPATATALAAWTFLFWAAPAAAGAADRLGAGDTTGRRGRAVAFLLPAAGVAGGAWLLFANLGALDRSAERGVGWARDSLAPVPEGSLFLTRNPVHLALAAEGERPDVEIAFVEGMGGHEIGEIVARNPSRPVFLDASVFFDLDRRTEALGERWKVLPHGLAFRVVPRDEPVSPEKMDLAAGVWDGMDLSPPSPASPLRGGLTAAQFYARGLLQSAHIYLDLGLDKNAECELLFGLSLEDANPTLAAIGLGRIFLKRRNATQAIRTLEDFAREEDEGAWIALQLLGSAYERESRYREAADALRRALGLLPPGHEREKADLERRIGSLRRKTAARPPAGWPGDAP